MKYTHSKQRLSSQDLPPVIPASLATLDLDHAVNTFQPGQYKLKDLPDKIPIINEKTGSFRRFIKKKPNDRRRIVSAPPGTFTKQQHSPPPSPTQPKHNNKELPSIPNIPNRYSTPIIQSTFKLTPRSVSLVNENIPQSINTSGYNSQNSLVIEERPEYLTVHRNSVTHSIETDSILSKNSNSNIIAQYLKDGDTPKLDVESFHDSLFSEDGHANSITSTEEDQKLALPKMRTKKGVRFQDKPSSYKVNSKSMNCCLESAKEYKDSRFPSVPSHTRLKKEMIEIKEKRRSLSDLNHMKVSIIDNPTKTKQDKRRSLSDIASLFPRSVSTPQPSTKKEPTPPETHNHLKSFISRFKNKKSSNKEKSLPPLPHQ
ncbi:hypothetical protein G210_2880 [Candida maltosa Xu316]|uniref:Uncharacterized protein n=1 Tax=Candida maltosa (strain Xu316) TaxID=1245528 RepID=M3JVB4_CANMX|nr:hypothetical protein G210_2880 [Candida maltosa Xu316]